MRKHSRRTSAFVVIASLAIAGSALAAQPVSNGTYEWGAGTTITGTSVDLTLAGRNKLSIHVSCGATGIGVRSAHGTGYSWMSKRDATLRSGGSFSYHGPAVGEKFAGATRRGRGKETNLTGTMTLSGTFTTVHQATGSASVGTCHAPHFTAQYVPPGQI